MEYVAEKSMNRQRSEIKEHDTEATDYVTHDPTTEKRRQIRCPAP